jgi:hypothetical protein
MERATQAGQQILRSHRARINALTAAPATATMTVAVATQQSTLDADLVKRASHVLAKAETKAFVLLSRRGVIACAREERKQIRVDLILVRRAHAVRQARMVDFDGPLDELGRLPRRHVDRHDLIVVSVRRESTAKA